MEPIWVSERAEKRSERILETLYTFLGMGLAFLSILLGFVWLMFVMYLTYWFVTMPATIIIILLLL